MGPRSHERGNGCPGSGRHGVSRASMGPRSHERGNVKETILSYDETLLQWGRVLTNAETTPRCPRSRPSSGSFNGAAFSRTRKRFLIQPHPDDHVDASMGPRSHERGNAPSPLSDPEASSWLQWGRVLTNAETSPRQTDAATKQACFNGAAFSRTRKPGRLSPVRRPFPWASMGPRSHERGNISLGSCSCARARGFNGAAFSRTRKPEPPPVEK